MTQINYAQPVYGASVVVCDTEAGAGANLIDGNESTYWNSHTQFPNPWFYVDLGELRQVEAVRIHQPYPHNACAHVIAIDASNDHVEWNQMEVVNRIDGDDTWSLTPFNCRYIRFRGTSGASGYGWGLYTVEVWGGEEITPPPADDVDLWIQWLYDNSYQQAADKLEELDPGWTFSIVETFLLAGMATIVSMVAQLLAQSGSGGASLEDIETALSVTEGNLDAAITVAQGLIQDDIAALAFATPTDVSTALSVTEGNLDAAITVAKNAVQADIAALDFATDADVDAAVGDVNDHTDSALGGAVTTLQGDITSAANNINSNVDSKTAGVISDLSNVIALARDVITGDIADLAAAVAGYVTDILTAIGLLRGPTIYPGAALVTWGTSVAVDHEDTLSAATHGVNGAMDGVRLVVTSVPARVTVRTAEGVDNYRYAGWLTFADSAGRCEEPQYVNLGERIYVPKSMNDPAYCICAFTHNVHATVTPWVAT